MTQKLSITDLPISGKKILMRVDFNVPLDKSGNITDDTRIRAALPSIQYVLKHGGSVILMSHLGRPKDKRVLGLSLAPCAKSLSNMLNHPVIMASDCVGPEVEERVKNLKPGEVILLENLRFHRAEEHPEEDPSFAQQLARLGSLYVNDAFGTAHRAHSSTATITQYFPHASAAGFLMEKEIQFLGSTLQNPQRPFYAIIGGAKISTKFGVLKSLLHKVDTLFIGGGMAYTFFKAKGIAIGNSIHEDEMLEKANELLVESHSLGVKLFLPQDIVVANEMDNSAKTQTIDIQNGIPAGFEGVDIGPKTIQFFSSELKKAATILWNGPLGVFELEKFAKGTNAIAHTVADLHATTIIGGGDSIAALQAAKVADKISHISTGGGAALEYVEFGKLPGIEALSDA